MVLIGGSVLALVIIAIPTLRAILYSTMCRTTDRSNAYEVTATGYQWWFKFDYPGEPGSTDGCRPQPSRPPTSW